MQTRRGLSRRIPTEEDHEALDPAEKPQHDFEEAEEGHGNFEDGSRGKDLGILHPSILAFSEPLRLFF
jgi:hypothetical protein